MDIVSKVINKNRKELKVSNRVFRLAVIELALMIKQAGQKYNSLYGIPRGGQVVAVYLSHLLNLPIVEKDGINEHTLIVDDICDNGFTLYELYNGIKIGKNFKLHTATLFYRKNNKFKPTYRSQNAKEYWVVFPWENGE